MARIALTGTPGVGKSVVARRLPKSWVVDEVSELARAHEAARPLGPGTVEVDLTRLRRALSRSPSPDRPTVWVGHLAHLLPVRDCIVLRCRPDVLYDRLVRARRGAEAERRENALCEATDIVLAEAAGLRRRVWEIDTTDRSIGAIAGEIVRLVGERPPPRRGAVRWLSDPAVTEWLLHMSR